MSPPKFLTNYEQLEEISRRFSQQAQVTRAKIQELQAALSTLEGGDWVGEGARKFYAEMQSSVLPSYQRLATALQNASQLTLTLLRLIREAEADAARVLTPTAEATVRGNNMFGVAFLANDGEPGLLERIGKAISDFWDWLTGNSNSSTPAPTPTPTPGNKGPVTPEQANKIFEDMSNEPDIAFNYPVDGCYARAHLMAERIGERYETTPKKVWAFGDLRVPTSGPYGEIEWGYHVAPVVDVRQPDGSVVPMVIDPSISKKPLTIEEWKGLMNDPNAKTQVTDLGTPPTNPNTGIVFPGSGYWPGSDPRNGDLNGYSDDVMKRYKEAGEKGEPANPVTP
jgi:WXG100 family type VII secretion target